MRSLKRAGLGAVSAEPSGALARGIPRDPTCRSSRVGIPHIAQAFVASQPCEDHRQILVPAREAPPVRITTITGHTLLKLIGGQVAHELSEYSLADIHPSLSAIATAVSRRRFWEGFRLEKFKSAKSKLQLSN